MNELVYEPFQKVGHYSLIITYLGSRALFLNLIVLITVVIPKIKLKDK